MNMNMNINDFIDSLDYNQLLYALECTQKRIQEKEKGERIKLCCVAYSKETIKQKLIMRKWGKKKFFLCSLFDKD
ncbi:hypothetical protein [Frischella perrara]|uniref:hypothetical protein n=1 Tax=Frischella perrara TaxID=1267021 RepID=UPI0023F2247B|nr:hypothetical protein [Frischella perrara]MCT6875605.1 hypothetical protein [Frischella perrara]